MSTNVLYAEPIVRSFICVYAAGIAEFEDLRIAMEFSMHLLACPISQVCDDGV